MEHRDPRVVGGRQYRLALAIGLLLYAAILGMLIFRAQGARQADLASSRKDVLDAANLLADQTELALGNVNRTLGTVEVGLRLTRDDCRNLDMSFHEMLQNRIIAQPILLALFVLDMQGDVLESAGLGVRPELPTDDKGYALKAIGGLRVGAVRSLPGQPNRWVFSAMREMLDDNGHVANRLLAVVDLNAFLRALSLPDMDTGTVLSLSTARGRILGRSQDMQVHLGRVYPGLADLWGDAPAGWAEFHSPLDNVDYLVGYVRLREYPFYGMALRPLRLVLAQWHTDMLLYAALAAIFGALLAVMLVRLARSRERLDEALVLLDLQAATDQLTGLFNRHRFTELAEREMTRSRRTGSPLSLVMFDIDHFKKVNDTYGHEAGDMALVAVADTAKCDLRGTDALARHGGEEFTLLLPDTDLEGARNVAEKIRRRIADQEILTGNDAFSCTASFGVALFRNDGEDGLDALIARADAALYRAKQSGRNRVELEES